VVQYIAHISVSKKLSNVLISQNITILEISIGLGLLAMLITGINMIGVFRKRATVTSDQ
jgi:hypothetical protein